MLPLNSLTGDIKMKTQRMLVSIPKNLNTILKDCEESQSEFFSTDLKRLIRITSEFYIFSDDIEIILTENKPQAKFTGCYSTFPAKWFRIAKKDEGLLD